MATPEQVNPFSQVVKSRGVKELDTARACSSSRSEELLGLVDARKDFLILTRASGFEPHSLKHEAILGNSNKSHQALLQGKVGICYTHGPDDAALLEDRCQKRSFDSFGAAI